jgi:hypothetical protein
LQSLYPKQERPVRNEKTHSQIHALQGLPDTFQVQIDGQVHDEGRLQEMSLYKNIAEKKARNKAKDK